MYNFLKKHIIALILLPIVLQTFSCSQNDDTSKPSNTSKVELDFIKTLGGSKNESAKNITKTSDGGYVVLGHTQSINGDITNKNNESFDYWLLKFNANNSLQWQKTYGGSDDDRGSCIIQTLDDGYAITGFSKSANGDVTQNNGFNDFWVSKLDSSGTISWEKSFGFSGVDQGISIIQTNDKGFLLTGVLDVSASNGQGNSKSTATQHAGGDYWAIKLNTLGEKEWSKFYGGTFTDTPYDAIQTEDNGYIIVGSSDSNDVDIKANKGSYDFWVVKISETGDLLWEKSYGGSEIDEARAIEKSNDGNYIIVGDTRSSNLDVSFNNGAADLWIIKISPSGNLIWEKSFGGTNFDAGRSISKTQNGDFIISGSSRSSDNDLNKNNGQNDAWVLKIDTNGNLKWQKNIGGSSIDLAHDAIEINNKTIISVGESNSSDIDITTNNGFTDLLILKIKENQ
ncbi:hypothetical protein A8C32_11430 [Flavivirga aquatica]|uniref:Bulb-type lectin domain-containing protein n=1 Tax=Flavivirga aquatica TaxID=1849968 RepID=A0A1E5TDA3_9FLAO|nr:hypothetical protein [Flavivirga aquatica]OEK09328.1 hypothetical protein A8C32_11430 [Flavivirga aquatica]